MQPLTYQQTSGFSPTAVINRSQIKQVPGHEKIRDAVRAWSAADNQDVVAALIVNEYREQGGGTIDFPDDVSRSWTLLMPVISAKRPGSGPVMAFSGFRHPVKRLSHLTV